ncbi:MAG: transposase [Cyclobacteriaceae bacterium]
MESGLFYHVYNHANGDENLFRQDENYHYFLKLWAKYIEPIADTYAYCLMPNHFHALIRIKSEENMGNQTGFQNLSGFISKTFSNFFNAYAKAYNKMYERRGSLFNRPFKAKEIDSDAYLIAVITYIHRNPVHHGFCDTLEAWPHSSYHAYYSQQATKLKRQETLEWFGGVDAMEKRHALEPRIPDTSLFIDY